MSRELAPSKTRLPWEQLIDEQESEKAFAMFVIYRDMGQRRTLSRASEAIYPIDPEKPRQQSIVGRVADCSKRFRWKERAIAFDGENDRQRRVAQLLEIRKMEDRHIGIAIQLQQRALEALSAMHLSDMGPSHILNFLAEAVRIEREARGMKDTIKVEHINADPADGMVEKEETPESLQLILAILADHGVVPKGADRLMQKIEDKTFVDVELVDEP